MLLPEVAVVVLWTAMLTGETVEGTATWRRVMVGLGAAATVAGVWGAAGCTSVDPAAVPAAGASTGSAPSPEASVTPGKGDLGPQALCDAFSRALFTQDTATDGSPDDAVRRAAVYATPALAAAAPAGGTDATWQLWAAHRARTSAVSVVYAGDADGADPGDRLSAMSLVTVTALGRDGWVGPTQRSVVHCELAEQGNGPLRVDRYDVEPLGAG